MTVLLKPLESMFFKLLESQLQLYLPLEQQKSTLDTTMDMNGSMIVLTQYLHDACC